MKIGRLNHIGIATPDIEATRDTYAALYGADAATPVKDFPKLGVKVCFVSIENTELELLQPLGPDSPVNKFLEKNPKGGQHHMCFEVDDIIARYSLEVVSPRQNPRQRKSLPKRRAEHQYLPRFDLLDVGKDERPELDGEIDKAGVQIVHIAAIRVATRGWVVTAALRRVAFAKR